MAFSVTVGVSRQLSAGGDALSGTVVITGGTKQEKSQSFAANTTDVLIPFAFTRAALKEIWISTDKNVTLETNSGSAPDDTIALAAGDPYHWRATNGVKQPFAADVTGLYFTNGAGAVANIEVRVLTT